MKRTFAENVRIVWAITSKDLIDGIKNKNVITLIISALFIVLVYKYIPGLTAEDGPPALLVYAAGESKLLTELENSPAVDLYTYKSEEDMKYYLTNGEEPELGLVIPENFDAALDSGNALELQGYMLQFFKEDEVFELKRYMEDEFTTLLDQPVTISIERIPLQPETGGVTVLTSMGFAFVTIMVGMMVIPHMMIEEKQAKTLDALMISPAKSGHIVLGKAFAGLVYAILLLIIALIFNWDIIQQGWLFLLGGLMGTLFAVSLGILLGIIIDNRQQLTLWSWVALIPLLIPMMVSLFDDMFPEAVVQIIKLVPSSAMLRVFRTSMSGTTPMEYFVPQLANLAIFSGIFLSIAAWLLRRQDR
jgi:ABC-2 type transport system permease protein